MTIKEYLISRLSITCV